MRDLDISKERKIEIDNILKETERKIKNGEICSIPLAEFLEKQRKQRLIMNELDEKMHLTEEFKMIDMNKEKERIIKLQSTKKIEIDDIQYGDAVKFSCNGIEKLIGTIAIKDRHGGGIYAGMCPSVDIQGADGIFYKHIPIVDIEFL